MNVPTLLTKSPHSVMPLLSSSNFSFLQHHVQEATGIVLGTGKEYLLEARIAPLLAELHIESFDSLCATLKRDPAGLASRRLVDAVTTNETLLFRDSATFEALRKEIVPGLLANCRGRKLRVWSAAASSGQEAYSIAILLQEMNVPASQVEIVGTDISSEILHKAKRGRFVQFEVNRGLPPKLLTKYFDLVGSEWHAKPQLRQMITFKQGDLRCITTGDGEFDLVLCRNVLIYFDHETKEQILNRLCNHMAPGGVLVLGCAETLINVCVPLQRLTAAQATFYVRSLG